MIISIQINNLYSKIEGFLPPEVLDSLSLACSFAPKGAEFSIKCQQGHWDGTRKLFKRRYQSFLTGLLSTVCNVLDSHGIQYNIEDLRIAPQISQISLNLDVRDYQEQCTKEALEKTRGIIKAACGSGKTIGIADFISKTNITTLVITHTTSVFNQTIERLRKDLGIEIGVIGNGSWEFDKKITVGLTASLVRWRQKRGMESFMESIQCLLIDEAHHVPTQSILTICSICNDAYYRIGLSASPWRDSGDDLLLNALTGRQLIDISASYLIQRGYLAKPTIKFIHFKQQRQSRELKYKDFYTKVVVENIERNTLIANIALKHIIQGESVLVSVSRIRHGEILEEMIKRDLVNGLEDKVKFVNGEDHPEELAQTLVDLHEKKLLVVVATSVYKEGVDIKSLDCLINCKAEDSSVAAFQTIGRALRKSEGKDTVICYDIYDENVRWLSFHSQNRERIYRTESEFVIEHIYEGTI